MCLRTLCGIQPKQYPLTSKLPFLFAKQWPRNRVSITSGSLSMVAIRAIRRTWAFFWPACLALFAASQRLALWSCLPKSRSTHCSWDMVVPWLVLSCSVEVALRFPCAGPRSDNTDLYLSYCGPCRRSTRFWFRYVGLSSMSPWFPGLWGPVRQVWRASRGRVEWFSTPLLYPSSCRWDDTQNHPENDHLNLYRRLDLATPKELYGCPLMGKNMFFLVEEKSCKPISMFPGLGFFYLRLFRHFSSSLLYISLHKLLFKSTFSIVVPRVAREIHGQAEIHRMRHHSDAMQPLAR